MALSEEKKRKFRKIGKACLIAAGVVGTAGGLALCWGSLLGIMKALKPGFRQGADGSDIKEALKDSDKK